VETARAAGVADPHDVDEHLRQGVKAALAGDHVGARAILGALLPAIVGGAGTVLGPVLGAFVLTPLSELTRYALRGRAGADIMLYGAILVLVISFLPQGLVGFVRARRGGAR